MGIYNLPASVEKYSTDYFIYANKYARSHGATEVKEKHRVVSTNDFIPMAFEKGNTKVDPCTALLTDVQNRLPTMWQTLGVLDNGSTSGQVSEAATSVKSGNSDATSLNFVNGSGKVISDCKLTRAQKKLLHDYRLIQYDITSGNQYSLEDHFTTNLHK